MQTFDVQFGEFIADIADFDTAYSHLRRSISAICRVDRGVTKYYIGKASGVEPIAAIYRRYQDKKTGWELTEDWALYQSACRHTVGLLEDRLNEHYMRNDPNRCLNSGTGSAGRPSTQPMHYIYLALRRH